MLSVSVTDHVGVITLGQPTMAPALFQELYTAVSELNRDDELRVIIVRSKAKSFSYGLDLPAAFAEYGELFRGGLAAQRDKLRRLIAELQAPMTALADSEVPVIAAIHGHCIGAGLDLATACDIRLATTDALFSLRETKVAMVADLGSLQRLPLIIGGGHTREMAFTGKDVDATAAKAMGLVNHVYSTQAELWQHADALAAEIAANAPLVVRGVKKVLAFGDDHTVTEGLDYVAVWNAAFLASDDLGEAFAAFAAKRTPTYKGC